MGYRKEKKKPLMYMRGSDRFTYFLCAARYFFTCATPMTPQAMRPPALPVGWE
jgi:hypothetical protein